MRCPRTRRHQGAALLRLSPKPSRAGSSPPAAPQGRVARSWCLALSRAAPHRHLARQSVRPVFWEGNKTPYGTPIWAERLPGKEGWPSQAHGVLLVPPTPVLLPAGHPPRHRDPCGPGAGPAGAGGAGTGWGGSTALGVARQPLCLQLVILGNDCRWERSNVQLPQQGLAAVLEFGSKMSNSFDTPGGDQPHTHFPLFFTPVFLRS